MLSFVDVVVGGVLGRRSSADFCGRDGDNFCRSFWIRCLHHFCRFFFSVVVALVVWTDGDDFVVVLDS